ncbi:MAG: hypothetical protein PHN84_12850 [Desulfuromonadaceae bacterium]|nr:hypothetical protein [Desulfuromonadaceae bacterium]MDD2856469.1 hypothetical protein [Desulfuromonadaceae bacterium]
MKDYAKLYRHKYRVVDSKEKIRRIKQVCKRNIPPELLLVLILAIVFPSQVASVLKR